MTPLRASRLTSVLLGTVGAGAVASAGAAHPPGAVQAACAARPTNARVAREVERPCPPLRWAVDLEKALDDAAATQRLVLVCFNMDGEQANERALEMYRSAEFAKAAADVICVVCSPDEHDPAPAPCSRFGTCSCAEHQAAERQARRHFFGALRDNFAPQHLLLFPDGLVAWQAIYEVAPAALCQGIQGAERLRAQPLAHRLRAQQAFLAQMRGPASRDVATAYLCLQARLVQTPPASFVQALSALDQRLTARVLRDLAGYAPGRARPLLEACAKHPTRAVRELAQQLAAGLCTETATPPGPVTLPPPAPLLAPLPVLGPADDLGRVHWVGPEPSLAACRDRITLMWFFLPDAPDLGKQVADMNQFAAAHAARGIVTLGVACCLRPDEAVEQLAALGCGFPVGAYQTTVAMPLCGVTMFPSWVVLDPETNVVHRSCQDGSSFDWLEARQLAARMAASPLYQSRLASAPAK
jgi:hypothetical protein